MTNLQSCVLKFLLSEVDNFQTNKGFLGHQVWIKQAEYKVGAKIAKPWMANHVFSSKNVCLGVRENLCGFTRGIAYRKIEVLNKSGYEKWIFSCVIKTKHATRVGVFSTDEKEFEK